MRKMSVIFIAATAATVLIVLLAVTPSGAVTFCLENENPPCAEGNRYRVPTKFESKLQKSTSVTFTGTPNVSCSGSVGTAESTVAGTPLLGEGTSLSFSSCTGCTAVEARNLPWNLEVEAAGGGNGTITLSGSGLGNPGIKFSSCLSGATCVYGAATASGTMTGGSPATIGFSGLTLNREEGSKVLCGATTSVAATYVQTAPPEPLFVSALP
jgi:hypothetical protein